MMENDKLQAAKKSASAFVDIKALRNLADFSRNGRKRYIHLSAEEISNLCDHHPREERLFLPFVREIQSLLRKMDRARKADDFPGRPYVSTQLASAVRYLALLRYLEEIGLDSMLEENLNVLLRYNEWENIELFLDNPHSLHEMDGRVMSIHSTIRLLELYRDELIKPPRLKCRVNFDEHDLHLIETGDLHWMDDGGAAWLEIFRETPLITYHDNLPHFESVLDWFIATKPVLDKNRVKRGWAHLEKLSEEWHQRNPIYFEDNISDYPDWNCYALDHRESWFAALPPDNPYRIVPLTTPQQLLEESQAMHHCAVTYISRCCSGCSRIFSVRAASNHQRIATAELTIFADGWELVQLKGPHNEELIYRTLVPDDPLAIALDVLVKWYNEIALS